MLERLFHNQNIRSVFLYGVIGGLAAVVDFSVFALLVKGLRLNEIAANIITAHLGMLVSFSLNTFLNFRKPDKLLRRFLSYYGIVVMGIAVSSGLIWLGTLYFPVLAVKAVTIAIVSASQYLLNRLITYKF